MYYVKKFFILAALSFQLLAQKPDYNTGIKNQPGLYTYQAVDTLTTNCTKSNAVGMALVVSVSINAMPSQTVNCNSIIFTNGAQFQAASNQVIVIQSYVSAPPNQQIFDTHLGGHFDFSTNTVQNEISAGWFGLTTSGFNETFYSTYANQVTATQPLIGVYIPAGNFNVTNVNITSNNYPINCQTSSSTSGCYGPSYIRGAGATSTVLTGTATSGYVLNALSLVNSTIKDIGIIGNINENCITVDWPSGGPSLINKFENIRCTNYKNLAFSAKNQNDVIFDRIVIAGTNAGNTSYALKILGDAGACGLRQLEIDSGKLLIDCQNYSIGGADESYIRQGLEIGFDSYDTGVITNTQIEAAPDTNIVINSTHSSGIQGLICNSCYLSGAGLPNGGSILGGPWYVGATFNEGWINIGVNSGTLCGNLATGCGAITAGFSGYAPKFTFDKTWMLKYPGIPAQPSGSTGAYIAYKGINDARTGILVLPDVDTYDLKNGYVQHIFGGGVFGTLNNSNNTCSVTSIPYFTDFFFACGNDGTTYVKAQANKNINIVIGANVVGLIGATAQVGEPLNFVFTETGVNNAIAGVTLPGALSLTPGMQICVNLAHTLQAGANTFNFNGTGAVAIKSHFNQGNNIATGYAVGGIWCGIYNATNWLDISQ